MNIFSFKTIQIWLKSVRGPIEVYLCPDEKNSPPNSPMKELSPIKSPPTMPTLDQDRRAVLAPADYSCNNESQEENSDDSLQQYNVNDIFPRRALFLQSHDTVPADIDSESLIELTPCLTDEDYTLLSLDETEGIADLFDDLF